MLHQGSSGGGGGGIQSLQNMGSTLPQFQPIATVLPSNFFSVVPAGTVFHSQGPSMQPTQTLQHQQQLQQAGQTGLLQQQGMLHHHHHQPQSITIPTIITTAHVDNKAGKHKQTAHAPASYY
jgi:hypothetical protein